MQNDLARGAFGAGTPRPATGYEKQESFIVPLLALRQGALLWEFGRTDLDLIEGVAHGRVVHLSLLGQGRTAGVAPEQFHAEMAKQDPFWIRLVIDDRLVDIASQFIGPDLALFATHYICKPPRTGQAVLWHQDGSYWPLEPMEVITLWLAVDDSLPENGCMRVIPCSHRIAIQARRDRTDVVNVLGSEIDPAFVDESRAVDVAIKAGGVSIHHPNLIHGSNATTTRRVGGADSPYGTSQPTTRILTEKQWPSAFLLRGRAVPGQRFYIFR